MIFDWVRGQIRGEVAYPPGHTYNALVEYEIPIKGRSEELDMDYFGLREDLKFEMYTHPRDTNALRDLNEAPLPSMRIAALREVLIPRPSETDARSSVGSVHSRLGQQENPNQGAVQGG